MQEDQGEMIRYFADFLSEIGLIIASVKDYVYELIEVNLAPSKALSVFQSMSSIILATHKTYDDLKKIQSILTGLIKSKRITAALPEPVKPRSASTCTRLHALPAKHVALPPEAHEAKTIKRGLVGRSEIKEVLEGSASSEEELRAKADNNRTEDNLTRKHSAERAMQHSSSQLVLTSSSQTNQQRVRNLIKHNGVGLSKILEANNECLRIVRSARKELRRQR